MVQMERPIEVHGTPIGRTGWLIDAYYRDDWNFNVYCNICDHRLNFMNRRGSVKGVMETLDEFLENTYVTAHTMSRKNISRTEFYVAMDRIRRQVLVELQHMGKTLPEDEVM